jgi:hypothetical protein
MRVWLVDLGGGPTSAIIVDAAPTLFAKILPDAEQIVTSMRFGS